MPDKSTKLAQFWRELKRRKVIRRNTVYAASGFVILELVSIIADPFGLPEWTLKLVFILLCIGFVISTIISWFYDFTPDGLERIKPAKKSREAQAEKPAQLLAWKIATYISIPIIAGLLVFNILKGGKSSKDLKDFEKSIAVLPFKSLSDDPEKQYLADGIMDAILLHLSKIENLRVMPRTSIEQYRETDKTVTSICQELDVAFLLEGSFQKYGDHARLIVQLIEPGKEGHIWAEEYDRNWTDIFSVQSEVAQAIADELQVIITPEEKQLIEKTPTTNLIAYDFYQRGREEYIKYWLDNGNKDALERAEDLYNKALEYDSTYAQAYTGLAWIYWSKNYWKTFLTDKFLDSTLILVDIALSFDNKLAEAYVIKGTYYRMNNQNEQALSEYDKAIKLNPNDGLVYYYKGLLYQHTDIVKAYENFHKAEILLRGPFLPRVYRRIGWMYGNAAGFKEKAIYYLTEALKLDDDSSIHFKYLAEIEESNCNFEKAIELLNKSYAIDSTDWWTILRLGMNYSYIGLDEKYFEYLKKYNQILKILELPADQFKLGHAYWVNGLKKEAENYFASELEFHNKMLEMDRVLYYDFFANYNLGGAYAFLGDKDKAYENLKVLNQKQRLPFWLIKDLKYDRLFDSIRDETEFQQIVKDVEAKYQAEHERVRKLLEENDVVALNCENRF